MAFTERYSSLLRFPGVLPVLAVGASARLAVSMYGLALLLLAQRATGSLTDAGLVAAAAAVGYAVTGPLLGRLADRFGPVRPLVGTAVLNVVAFAGMLVVTGLSAPVVAIAAAALLIGASVPPVSACQRALWRGLLAGRDELLDTALALDSFSLDVFLISGPLLVTGLVVFAGSPAAVIVTATLMLAGSVGFAALPACRGAPRRGSLLRARGLGPLRSPGFRLLVVTIAAAGMALGIVRISLIGFAAQAGDAAVGGLLYTAIGIGSAAGGLWYGSRTWTIPLGRRYTVLLAVYA
ncbi:MAG: MFS transporter, partial [Sciscionella sp.]